MPFQAEDIQKLGALARLRIEPEEVDDLVAKLTDIIGLVGQLEAADTESIVPMAHPLDREQRLRPDQVTETDRHDLYQQNSAHVAQGLYLVPKVIE